jgi:hypothetical protein
VCVDQSVPVSLAQTTRAVDSSQGFYQEARMAIEIRRRDSRLISSNVEISLP